MLFDKEKTVELYRLKAENFDEEIAPHQKKYYEDTACWIEKQNFETAEEATAAMKNTEFYEGGSIAKTSDDIELRIKAMEKVGYDDVADIHRQRREKFRAGGNSYAFSQEWIDDYNRAAEKSAIYAERKEVFGRLFSGYFQIAGNPQSEHRKEAAKGIKEALDDLQRLGVTFDELASQKVYRNLTMTTEKGMENFIQFIHEFMAGKEFDDDISDIKDEQERVAKWITENTADVLAAGKEEIWHRANCISIPSDDPLGYDFTALKEVED